MTQTCSSCTGPKATIRCRRCECALCKGCSQRVTPDRFAFLNLSEENDLAGTYCNTCFDTSIAAEMEKYDQTMELAKEVSVYFVDQGKETRLFKRSDNKFSVKDCADRDETIMRLAFLAAQAGCNTLVDVDLVYAKVRDGSFKISHWTGSATGANLDSKHRNVPTSTRRSPSR